MEEEEDDNDAAAQVDGDDGVDIEYDVRIDFDARIGLGEKTDRDEMVGVDVKNKVGA